MVEGAWNNRTLFDLFCSLDPSQMSGQGNRANTMDFTEMLVLFRVTYHFISFHMMSCYVKFIFRLVSPETLDGHQELENIDPGRHFLSFSTSYIWNSAFDKAKIDPFLPLSVIGNSALDKSRQATCFEYEGRGNYEA